MFNVHCFSYHSSGKGHCGAASRDIREKEIICEYNGSLTTKKQLAARKDMYNESPTLYPLADYDGVSATKVWDGYHVNDNGNHRTITIMENKGAWINSFVEGVEPTVNTIMPMPDESPANCRIQKIQHKNVSRLYAVAITNIPRSYEIIQNYHENNLIFNG